MRGTEENTDFKSFINTTQSIYFRLRIGENISYEIHSCKKIKMYRAWYNCILNFLQKSICAIYFLFPSTPIIFSHGDREGIVLIISCFYHINKFILEMEAHLRLRLFV